MTDKVFEHRGSLDKYIGDAIMAVFGAPLAEPQHPALACRSALDMLRVLQTLRERWRARGMPADRHRRRHQHRADGGRQHGLGQPLRLHGRSATR